MIDIKRLIKDLKITQVELASILGCKQGYISRIANNKEDISPNMLKKLKEIYGDIVNTYITNISNNSTNKIELHQENYTYITLPTDVWEKMSQLIDTVTSQQRTIESLSKKVKSEDVPRDDGAMHAAASGFSEK
ncbi:MULTISPECIES: helix-turn-helix domain-containing protein [Sanguibacteroides]|uniref:helix-turn-helix domain-containing protein n=1 Tax=Sanguibacteroides TaxID=1635148 RepID=UPI0005A0BEE7|nr:MULTISPECIES: helix-turn-helix transcriptional regulator [Sanguibacteroides]PXZ44726.1 XRE family transcriptional regulator [Sanguibacteroides justesenii]